MDRNRREQTKAKLSSAAAAANKSVQDASTAKTTGKKPTQAFVDKPQAKKDDVHLEKVDPSTIFKRPTHKIYANIFNEKIPCDLKQATLVCTCLIS